MPTRSLSLPVPAGYDWTTVTHSHGWYQLAPMVRHDRGDLETTATAAGRPVRLRLRQTRAGRPLEVAVELRGRFTEAMRADVDTVVGRIGNLGIDVADFHARHPQYEWARELGAGPLLRSASLWEDVVKMLATTNCSFAATRGMCAALVETLGKPTPVGRLFPTPAQVAAAAGGPVGLPRQLGYRAAYLRELAAMVLDNRIDLDGWEHWTGTTAALVADMRRAPGIGPYAAENLCRLLGRWDGLAIDSWVRERFPQVHPQSVPAGGDVTAAVREHYRPYGTWAGLALWLDLTRQWHEPE